MKLVICEKPNLAQTIVNALKQKGVQFKSHKGYYESNEYYISYVFGHLFTLADCDKYNPEFKSWRKSYQLLPCIPHPFKFEHISETTKEQFNIICDLLKKSDSVIHCGDADREGEIIIRITLDHANNNKPVYRLWLPSQDETTILEAFDNLELDSNYDNLANEGYARLFSDWLVGINYTRYCTSLANQLLQVGRIKVPMVQAIYDREKEIENFIPQKYYVAEAKIPNSDTIVSIKRKFFNEQEAIEFCNTINQTIWTITDISQKDKIVKPFKLFSLTTLQNACSKAFKLEPNKTLEIAQSLYEKGYISYPRTNTEYLAEREADKMMKILSSINRDDLQFHTKKSVFDSAKVESHSALTPTLKLENNLSEKDQQVYNLIFDRFIEEQVYDLIFNRFIANFFKEDYIRSETFVTLSNGDETIVIKGYSIKQKGWTKVEQIATEEKLLPHLQIHQQVNLDFQIVQKITQPKKRYTVETFNSYLENPFKNQNEEIAEDETIQNDVDDLNDYKDLLAGVEIGTVATRSSTIKELCEQKYILLKKNTYYILEKGKQLIDMLSKLNIDLSKNKSVEISKKLKEVYKENISLEEFILYISLIVEQNCDTTKELPDFQKEVIGCCPRCNSDILKFAKKGYKTRWYCSNKECNFSLFEEMKYFNNILKLNDGNVKMLLANDSVPFHLKSQSGKSYKALLKLQITEKYVNFEKESYMNDK